MSASTCSDLVFIARDLTKVYGEGEAAVHALRGVNLDIVRGEFVVLLGASGSGKSTLLNILGGLDSASDDRLQALDVAWQRAAAALKGLQHG